MRSKWMSVVTDSSEWISNDAEMPVVHDPYLYMSLDLYFCPTIRMLNKKLNRLPREEASELKLPL
jgi:hypothetical protein